MQWIGVLSTRLLVCLLVSMIYTHHSMSLSFPISSPVYISLLVVEFDVRPFLQ